MLIDLPKWFQFQVLEMSRDTCRRLAGCTFALAIALALLLSQTEGAPITFNAPNLATTASDVSTAGTLVEALNLVSDDSLVDGTVTVNGVTFTDTKLLEGTFVVTGVVNTGDPNLDDLVGTLTFGAETTIDLTGLSSGQLYQLQIFAGDNRGLANGRTITVGDGDGDTSNDVTYTYADGGATLQATSIIGTFVADGTTQSFIATIGNGGSGTEFAGYQLREIPEPATLCLLALAGTGMFGIRCRLK